MNIKKAEKSDYSEIIQVWETSVRATHNFLLEEDISFYRAILNDKMLDNLNIFYIKNHQNKIMAFIGMSDEKVEMLFVDPSQIGKGLGCYLISFAKNEFHISKVDVNEQNEKAVIFYKNLGFKVISRSEYDDMGKAYPILHMSL